MIRKIFSAFIFSTENRSKTILLKRQKETSYTVELLEYHRLRKTSSDTPKTSSDTPKTSSDTPKTSSDTTKTSSDTPKTSSDTPKTSSGTPKTDVMIYTLGCFLAHSQNCKSRISGSQCPSICPSAWNISSPVGGVWRNFIFDNFFSFLKIC